jgi:hypothetical protein
MKRLIVLLLTSFAISLPATPQSAQQTTQPASDPQAVAILQNMVAASGWSPSNLPADVVGNGSMVSETPTGEQTEGVVVKARPAQQLRIEFSSSANVLVVNGFRGSMATSQGARALAGQSVPGMLPGVFPFYKFLAGSTAADAVITYLGQESLAGVPAHRIQVKTSTGVPGVTNDFLENASSFVISVSTANSLPLKIEFVMISASNPNSVLPAYCAFSDYRTVGAVQVPFHVEKYANGQKQFAIQLNSVQFNTGLTDADFDVPR